MSHIVIFQNFTALYYVWYSVDWDQSANYEPTELSHVTWFQNLIGAQPFGSTSLPCTMSGYKAWLG